MLYARPIFVGVTLALVVLLLSIISYSLSSSGMWEEVKARVLEQLRGLLGMGAGHRPIGSKRLKTRRIHQGKAVASAADVDPLDPIDDDEWDQSAEAAS